MARDHGMRLRTSFAAVATVAGAMLGLSAGADEGLKLSQSLSTLPVPAAQVAQGLAPQLQEESRKVAPAPVVPDFVPGRPRGIEYRIGTEDLLEVQVFGVEQLSRTVRVDSRGVISLPLIGMVDVAGLTVLEAQAVITAKLAESYLQNPQVTLFIKEFTTQRITVEGAVNRPGVYPLKGQTTLLTALALAGGQGRFSEMNEVVVFRTDESGQRVVTKYDVERIRRGEVADPIIVNDDLVVVNRSSGRVALRDSIFGDLLDVLNPFRYIPAP